MVMQSAGGPIDATSEVRQPQLGNVLVPRVTCPSRPPLRAASRANQHSQRLQRSRGRLLVRTATSGHDRTVGIRRWACV